MSGDIWICLHGDQYSDTYVQVLHLSINFFWIDYVLGIHLASSLFAISPLGHDMMYYNSDENHAHLLGKIISGPAT